MGTGQRVKITTRNMQCQLALGVGTGHRNWVLLADVNGPLIFLSKVPGGSKRTNSKACPDLNQENNLVEAKSPKLEFL